MTYCFKCLAEAPVNTEVHTIKHYVKMSDGANQCIIVRGMCETHFNQWLNTSKSIIKIKD